MSVTAYCKFKTIPLQDATKYCEIEEVNGDFWLKTPKGGTLLTDAKSRDDHFSQLTGYLGGASDDRWDIAEQLIGKDNIMTEDEWEEMVFYNNAIAIGTLWEQPKK
jgi:hypothetical protein